MISPKTGDRVSDVYIRNANLDDYSFSPDGNFITLMPRNNDMSASKNSTSFIGKRQRSQTATVAVTLHLPEDKTTTAGLALYKDNFRHVDICYNADTHKVALHSTFKFKGSAVVRGGQVVETKTLQMMVHSSARSYEFSIREQSTSNWISLGSIDALEMSGLDFNGTIFGLWASTTEAIEARPVKFEAFNIS